MMRHMVTMNKDHFNWELYETDTKKLFFVERKDHALSLFLPAIDSFYSDKDIKYGSDFFMYDLVEPERIFFGSYAAFTFSALMINEFDGLRKFEDEVLIKLRDQGLLKLEDIKIHMFDAKDEDALGGYIKQEGENISFIRINTQKYKNIMKGHDTWKRNLVGKSEAWIKSATEFSWAAICGDVYNDWIGNYSICSITY